MAQRKRSLAEQVAALWDQGKPEIITVTVVYVLGMAWGAGAVYLLSRKSGAGE